MVFNAYMIYITLMKYSQIIIFAFCITTLTAINSTCFTNDCSVNSTCASNNYCVCDPDLIGLLCNIDATALNSSSINANLQANNYNYFSVAPVALNQEIQFTFTICLPISQPQITFNLWIQTGNIANYTDQNSLGNPNTLPLSQGCQNLVTQPIEFGTQVNGQSQLLILGIDPTIGLEITINASQSSLTGYFVYYYLMMGLITFVCVAIIIVIVVFMVRRLRRNNNEVRTVQQQYHDIKHLDQFIPTFTADKLGSDRSVCPICLMQIQSSEVVRKTPCKHAFHSVCIDSWCLKNLNCPVCRSDLSYQALNQPRKSRMTEISKDPYKYQVQWQESIKAENQSIEQKYKIRQSML